MFKFEMFNQKMKYVSLLAVAICLSFVAYWPSFSVPFYLDDRLSIVENPLVANASVFQLWQVYGARFIGYLTFWANYQLFGADVTSFHIVNYSIHLFNAVILFYLVTLCCDYFQFKRSKQQVYLFSAIVCLVWLLHPLNTQAVTYVVQRLASLVTLFYLLALFSYLKIRSQTTDRSIYILLFITSVVLGSLTKQNFIVLIPTLLAIEFVFAAADIKRKLLFMCAACFITVSLLYPFYSDFFAKISIITKETSAISRYDYFVNQLTILWLYIGKFFWPLSLQLDMGVTLKNTNAGMFFVALLGHISLFSAAFLCRKSLPLFTVGIIMFYAGHSVESFIIPITDLAFEHRTYLPNIGLSIAASALLFELSKNLRVLVTVAVLLVLTLTTLTYQRNIQWQDPYLFYKNELVLSPDSPRTKASLAIELINRGELEEAETLLIEAVNTNFQQGRVTVTSLNNLMLLLFEKKNYQAAINVAMKALKYVKHGKDRSTILTTVAYGYIQMGWCDFATGLLNSAIKLDAKNQKAIEYLQACNKQTN